MEKYLDTSDGDTIETVFAQLFLSISSVSTEQSQICVKKEQSDPLFAPANSLVTTPAPSIEIPAQENQLQKHKERVEKLPQPDQLKKICTDAGFLKTVVGGQFFMTKHTDEFLPFAEPVTCREKT